VVTSASSSPVTLREALGYLTRLISMLRPYWGALAKGMVLGIGVTGVGLVTPMLSKLFFDRVYPTHDTTLLQVLVIGILVASVTSAILGAIKSYYSTVVGARLTQVTSLLFFNHLQHLPTRFFDEHRVGEVMSRFSDVRASLDTVSKALETLFVSGAYGILIPPILLAINVRLALLAFITVPVTSLVSTIFGRYVRHAIKQNMEANAALSAFQFEALSHIRMIKVSAAEQHIFATSRSQLQRAQQLQLRGAAITTSSGLANSVLRTAGQAALSWYAWTLILRQEISLGDFVAFSAYMAALAGPVGRFADLFMSFQQSAVSLGRMFEYLDLKPEQDPERSYVPAPPVVRRARGDIVLSHVHFEYAPGRPILQDVSLRVEEGLITAIVGPSGAGKSSLLRLLGRMETPSAGTIHLGDTALVDMPLPDVRRQMSFVWQEFSVMKATIWENLTFGVSHIPRATVEAAVRACRLDALIASLPDGYETAVGEWGSTLSSGQRQRLMLARALVRDAPILILDEVTANLDIPTEREILQDVLSSVRGKTVVVVTHRVAAAAIADRVVLLDAGRVVVSGVHRHLIAENDAYRRMFDSAVVPNPTEDAPRLRVVGDGRSDLVRLQDRASSNSL
jgi:ATP-binding cassette subfamily B protein